MTIKKRPVLGSMILLMAGVVQAGKPPVPAGKASTPGALKAEIAALKPARHVWREITWKTCPLEALKESREKKKPVMTWVFLGIPTDERS